MSFIHSTSKKSAIVLSYIAIILNTLTAVFLTPFLLRKLGVDGYGLYQMIYSVGNYILILNFGIATVMIRYISEFRAKGDKRGEQNFAAMIGLFVIAVVILAVTVGLIVNTNLEGIFKNLSVSDYDKSHQMLIIIIVQIGLTIIDHYYTGIIGAYERFSYLRIVNILQIVSVFVFTILFVNLGMGAVGIVLANAMMTLIKLLFDAYYSHFVLKFKIYFYYWNSTIVAPVVGLSMAIFLQSIVGNVNSSLDKTILGIMLTKKDVAMYSVAASIITMFNTIPGVFSGLFQPQVTRMIVNNASKKTLTDLVIRVGRWQFIVTGAMFFGFVLFGLDFMKLWVGEEMKGALWIILIIMPFNMIPLIQTVCLSILNAYDKRIFRSLILLSMTVLNVFITILLIKHIGIWGAPIGTAFSYLIGHVIIMNIYYSRYIHLNVRRMFKGIFNRIFIVLLSTSLLCLPLLLWTDINFISFGIKVVIFLIVYGSLLMVWGFNKEEKEIVNVLLLKVRVR
jgi:O-antigen/teichoic acid export membrane protein